MGGECSPARRITLEAIMRFIIDRKRFAAVGQTEIQGNMKRIFLGAVLTLALLLLSALVVTKLGLMPVSADGTHSRLEAQIMPVVLHASVARHASGEMNPVP